MNGKMLMMASLFLAMVLVLSFTVAFAEDEEPPPGEKTRTLQEITIEELEIAEAIANPPAEKPLRSLDAIAEAGRSNAVPNNTKESESNNNFRTADRLEVGDVIYGKIGDNKDQDCFVVNTAPYAGLNLLVDIDAEVDGSQLDAVVCLYDGDKDLVKCSDDSDGLDSLIYQEVGTQVLGGPKDVDWNMTEKIYLRVRDYNYPREGSAAYSYTLSVSRPLLISADQDGTLGGMPFSKADILAWQQLWGGHEKWSMFWDASDTGVVGDLEGVGTNHGLSLVLGKTQQLLIDGRIQKVKPQDVIIFEPITYGPATSGNFLWDYRGVDYGLTTDAEKIDALSYGGWYVSTVGTARHGISGLSFRDEDIFNLYYGHMEFDGSAISGLAGENVIAAETEYPSWLWLVIQGRGKIQGHNVNQKQIFQIDVDTGSWGGIVWDGRQHGFNYKIDAIAR